MTGEVYEYSPSEGSYEYKLIEDFKTSCSFEKHIHMFKAFLENAKQCCYIPDNMITLTDIIKKLMAIYSYLSLPQALVILKDIFKECLTKY